jgi:hypothetical protein
MRHPNHRRSSDLLARDHTISRSLYLKKKTLFAIYLVEDESGFVTVKSDHIGHGMMSYEIGLEILANLKMAEALNPEVLSVDYMYYSDQFQ